MIRTFSLYSKETPNIPWKIYGVCYDFYIQSFRNRFSTLVIALYAIQCYIGPCTTVDCANDFPIQFFLKFEFSFAFYRISSFWLLPSFYWNELLLSLLIAEHNYKNLFLRADCMLVVASYMLWYDKYLDAERWFRAWVSNYIHANNRIKLLTLALNSTAV